MQAALKGAQGISGENPGFPEEGYKDYLYVQYGYDHPFLLDSSKNVRSVISTLINTLVIFDDGTVSGIGCDPRYENPSGDFPEFPDTRPFGLPANITNIVSAAPSTWKYFMFLQGNGHVTSWGDSAFAFGRDTVPARVTNAISVAAGNAHAVAVLNDGRVAAWGNNSYRQTAVPANLVGVKSVAAGYNHTLALLQNGNVVAWGSNEFGETNVPSNVTDATSIAAGYCFSLVLLADGHVVAWGCDWYGQNIVPDDVTNAVAIAVADIYVGIKNSPIDFLDLLGMMPGVDKMVENLLRDHLGVPDTDEGRPYAAKLVRHYVLGDGVLFEGKDGVWGEFMRARPEIQEAINQAMEELTKEICKGTSQSGKVSKDVTGVVLYELASMRLTLHGCHRIEIRDHYKVRRDRNCCKIDYKELKFTWIDNGDLHPGTTTELDNGKRVDDLLFMILSGLIPTAGSYPIAISWDGGDSTYGMDEDGNAYHILGWPGSRRFMGKRGWRGK